jgi:hypothetical protein
MHGNTKGRMPFFFEELDCCYQVQENCPYQFGRMGWEPLSTDVY